MQETLLITAFLFHLVSGAAFSAGVSEETVHLQIITVKTEAALNQVLSVLNSGAEFADIAKKHSTHPTASDGGYLGEMKTVSLTSELRKEVGGLTEGSLSHFIDSTLGPTIVRKLDLRTARKAYARQHLLLGVSYHRENKTAKAIDEFKKGISLDPQSADAHLLLGYAYQTLDSHNMRGEAKAEFQQALGLDPTLNGARFHLAKTYIDLGRLQKAKEVLEERPERTEANPRLLSLLGEVNRQLGNGELSVKQITKALESDPSSGTARYYLARAYVDLRQEEQALQELNLALRSEEVAADMYLEAGKLHLKRKNPEHAIELLRKAIEMNASFPEAHLELARAYRHKGDLSLAFGELQRASQQLKKFPPGSDYYHQFQRDLYFEAGLAHEKRGRPSKAMESYSKALAADPNHGDAHLNLAKLYLARREFARSREHAQKAKELGVVVPPALLKQSAPLRKHTSKGTSIPDSQAD